MAIFAKNHIAGFPISPQLAGFTGPELCVRSVFQ